MKKNLQQRHQELLDEFAKAVLPTVYEKAKIDGWHSTTVAKEAYKIAQAMLDERSKIINISRECDVKKQLGITDCSVCPDKEKCYKFNNSESTVVASNGLEIL